MMTRPGYVAPGASREPKGAGAAWTEERGACDERRGKAAADEGGWGGGRGPVASGTSTAFRPRVVARGRDVRLHPGAERSGLGHLPAGRDAAPLRLPGRGRQPWPGR